MSPGDSVLTQDKATGASSPLDDNPRTQAEAFLKAVFEPGSWHEVRAPKCPDRPHGRYIRTASAYHDDAVAASADAMVLDALGAPGVYVTINPVDPEVSARACRRIRHGAESTTGDAEILRRRWLPIDVDAGQHSGVSSTDEERQAAFALSHRVRRELTAEGWPAPIHCSTPNGAQLLYPIEFPNDAGTTELVKRVLNALGERFDSPAKKPLIDRSVFNAARIMRIQIWTALIALLLTKRLHHLSKARWSFSNMASMLRLNLFTYRDLQEWLHSPFSTDPMMPDAVQAQLPLPGLGQAAA